MSPILHWTLLGIVCLAPLPLASNRPLPWSLLSLAVGVLLLVWGAGRLWAAIMPAPAGIPADAVNNSGRASHARAIDQHAAVLAFGFAILMAWYWVQGSPSFSGGWGHAAWAQASTALGESLPASVSLDAAAGATLMMKLMAYGGVFLLAFELGRERDRARTTYLAVCLACFGYAIYGLIVQFTHAGMVLWFAKDAYPDSVTATFINRNAYATYAGMGVIAALAVLLSELRRLKRDRTTSPGFLVKLSEQGSGTFYLAVVASLAGLVAVVLSGSRAGNACLLLGLLVFATGMLIAKDIRFRTFVTAVVLGAAVLAGVLWLSGGFLARRMTSESAPEARAAVFDVARAASAEHPWRGQGLGGFGPAFNLANDGRAIFDTYVDLAHNAYLELAVEGGIPAMLLSLALIGGCIGVCFTGLLARGATTSIAAIAIAALVGAHAMVDFGIQMPAVAATFMLLLGVAAAQALALEPAGRPDALETAPGSEERWRSPRQRRFGHDRPLSADEAVTPPPEPDMPWPVRRRTIDRALLARVTAPATDVTNVPPPESRPGQTSMQEAETMSDPEPAAPASDYEAALARWRTLREGGAAGPERESTPGRLITTRPPPPSLAETPAASELEPGLQPQEHDIAELAMSPDAASTAMLPDPPAPTIVPFAPRDRRPVPDDDAAQAAQPPTPPAWPGAAPGVAAPDPDDGVHRTDTDHRSATVVQLPPSSKS